MAGSWGSTFPAGATSRALRTNSSTASDPDLPASSAAVIGGTGNTCSPLNPSGVLLVVSTRSRGHLATSIDTRGGTGGCHLLAAVQHEEGGLRRQPPHEQILSGSAGTRRQPEHPCHRGRHRPGIAD